MKRRVSRRNKSASHPVPQRMINGGAALIAQNPVLVGGMTAFLLTMFFVSANALWYQPHGHPAAIFPTRLLQFEAPLEIDSGLPSTISEELETTIRIERDSVTPAPVDPVVQKVQSVLSDLNLYTGSIDGVAGPKTRDAIRNYRRIMGLQATDEIDNELLGELGAKPEDIHKAETPVPVLRPDPNAAQDVDPIKTARGTTVVRVQAGLRAFGNDHIEIDGITGPKTREAIREFQVLFGLEPTGEASEAVLSKMRELGLTG